MQAIPQSSASISNQTTKGQPQQQIPQLIQMTAAQPVHLQSTNLNNGQQNLIIAPSTTRAPSFQQQTTQNGDNLTNSISQQLQKSQPYLTSSQNPIEVKQEIMSQQQQTSQQSPQSKSSQSIIKLGIFIQKFLITI